MKILKKGVVEKREEEETKFMLHAPVLLPKIIEHKKRQRRVTLVQAHNCGWVKSIIG